MSKRQVSLKLNQLKAYIEEDKLLNFVLKSGSVFLACPLKMDSGNLKVKNTRGHKLDIPLTEIAEIWAEEKVTH